MNHNSFDLKYKQPFGAIRQNEKVYIKIDAEDEYSKCDLRIWTPSNNEIKYKMNKNNSYFDITIELSEIGLYWYYFILEKSNKDTVFYGCENGYTGGQGEAFFYPPNQSFQITCFKKDFTVPDWFKNKIMYQIFPDRFCRDKSYIFDTNRYETIHENWTEELGCTKFGANNFEYFAGNINGIISKLDYLKELNVSIIYLNPIFKSKSNHRYDTADYLSIDEMIGIEDHIKELIEQCKLRNMKVILDVSWNHVGDDSKYFNKYNTFDTIGAYQSKNSLYRQWFYIKEDNTYEAWWGIETLPVLNKFNTEYRKHVSEVITYWTNLGIAGFRLDVIDELPDDFLEWFRKTLKSINKELIVIGEVWEDATLKRNGEGKLRTYLYGYNQDSVMNYVLRNMIIGFLTPNYKEKEIPNQSLNGYSLLKKYQNLLNNYPIDAIDGAMNFLSTHDITRILTVFSDCPYCETLSKEEQGKYIISKENLELGIKRLKIAWSMLLCLKGNTSIFYGDECGLYGYNDPYNRKPMNWEKYDITLLNWFKSINTIKNKYSCLSDGDFTMVYESESVIAFSRKNKYNEIIYIANRDDISYDIKVFNKNINIEPLSFKIIERKEFLTELEYN